MYMTFLKAAALRASKTFIQTVLAIWTAGTLITETDWKFILVSALSAALYSLLTSILAGLPEVEATKILESGLYDEEREGQ